MKGVSDPSSHYDFVFFRKLWRLIFLEIIFNETFCGYWLPIASPIPGKILCSSVMAQNVFDQSDWGIRESQRS